MNNTVINGVTNPQEDESPNRVQPCGDDSNSTSFSLDESSTGANESISKNSETVGTTTLNKEVRPISSVNPGRLCV